MSSSRTLASVAPAPRQAASARSPVYGMLAGVAVLALLPAVLSPGLLNATNQMLIAVLFASAFNVLAGQSGMLAFGHAAYFGIGAFATIHAMNALGGEGLLPTPLMPFFGLLAGAALGLAAGWFSTQRTGVYFSMITLALAELIHALAPHLRDTFGGEAGVSSMRMPAWGLDFGSAIQVYYLTLAWVAASLALLYFFTRTPAGRLALGLRENSHRLKFLGYNVHMLRLMVFVLSTAFAGVAGSLQALANESANYVLFDVRLSSEVVLNAYIGGVGVFFGPALGAALMTLFGYVVSDLTRSWLLYQGILFVLIMMYLPTGLSGLLPWWRTRMQQLSAPLQLRLAAAGLLAGAMLLAGSVLAVELLQSVFAQDYQARLAAGQPWPAVAVLGRDWLPGAVTTWLLPLALLAGGALVARLASRLWEAGVQALPQPGRQTR